MLTAAPTVPLPAISGVILATPMPGAGPLDRVAGLPLALRAALALQAEGARRLYLVVAEGDAATAAAVAGDARMRAEVEVIVAASRAGGIKRACAAAGARLLVAAADVVAAPRLYRDLAAAPLEGRVAVIACGDGAPVGPLLASPALADALAGREDMPLEQALAALLAEGAAAPLEAGARWAFSVRTPEDRERAVDALLNDCRKPVDGLVARYLNRPVSLFLSRRLAGVPVSPNAVTGFTFLIAVAGALSAARGGYGPMLLGAALLQAASILDGVDGELARLRYQQSRLGQWLDTVVDDLSTLLFYAGVTAGAPRGPALLAAGALAMAALALTSLQYYAELRRLGSGDFYALDWDLLSPHPRSARARLFRLLTLLLKRDLFTLLYLSLAVAGQLPLALFIGAAGHTVALAGATARTARRLARRRS